MRQGTILFWLGAIVLFALFGFAFLKFIVAAIVLLLVFLFGSILVAFWLLRRRMNRKMAEFRRAFDHAQAEAERSRTQSRMRREAIDVEPLDVHDDDKPRP
jgi:hypothetical protein